jgi:hypothetical protein
MLPPSGGSRDEMAVKPKRFATTRHRHEATAKHGFPWGVSQKQQTLTGE